MPWWLDKENADVKKEHGRPTGKSRSSTGSADTARNSPRRGGIRKALRGDRKVLKRLGKKLDSRQSLLSARNGAIAASSKNTHVGFLGT